MADLDAMLDAVLNAKVSGSGTPVREGAFIFQVMDHLAVSPRNSVGVLIFCEFKVLAATKVNPAVEPNPIGSTCSVCFDLTTDSGPANMQKYFCGLTGVDARSVREKDPHFFDKGGKFDNLMRKSIKTRAGECPLKGWVIAGETFVGKEITKGKNKGKNYIGLNWRTLEAENTPELIAQRAAVK